MLSEIEEVLNSITLFTASQGGEEDFFTQQTFRPGTACYIPDSSGVWHLGVIIETLADKVIAGWQDSERYVLKNNVKNEEKVNALANCLLLLRKIIPNYKLVGVLLPENLSMSLLAEINPLRPIDDQLSYRYVEIWLKAGRGTFFRF
jgi:hypothetical protein